MLQFQNSSITFLFIFRSLTIEFGRDPEIVGRNTSYSVTLGDDTVLDDKNFPLFGAPDPTKPGNCFLVLLDFPSWFW